jgi:ribosomal protein L11 methyltransferase
MKALWTARLRCDAAGAAAAEAVLESFAIALSRYEVERGRRWEVEALIDGQPDRAAIRKALAAWGRPVFEALPERDWVAESRRALPAITAGRFYLRGAHVKGATPRGKIPLQIDAGAAFGTGRHETTRGCLLALDRLARRRRFKNPFDLGCGSGVLALAAASLWPVKVLAADNDPDAVRVTRENVAINGLAGRITVIKSSGYGAAAIRRAAPFDLITANILARPLYRMAGSLAQYLQPKGFAVLSGILATQEQLVLHAHQQRGLELDFRLRLGEWSVLVLRKPGRRAGGQSTERMASARSRLR